MADLSFYSADISALYTDLNIDHCIDAVISMAKEYWEELSTFGITLVELHKLLDLVFKNSFFTFDQKLYWQGEGLFMGCCPSSQSRSSSDWSVQNGEEQHLCRYILYQQSRQFVLYTLHGRQQFTSSKPVVCRTSL